MGKLLWETVACYVVFHVLWSICMDHDWFNPSNTKSEYVSLPDCSKALWAIHTNDIVWEYSKLCRVHGSSSMTFLNINVIISEYTLSWKVIKSSAECAIYY